MSERNTQSKKYNQTLAGLFESKAGNLYSLVLDPRNYEALTNIEVGGKIFVRYLTEETKAKIEAKGKKAPTAFLEYMDPKTVAESDAEYKSRATSGGGNGDDI